MFVLIVGGSPNHLGGVEAFCARSKEALDATGRHRVERIFANTAYLSPKRIPSVVRSMLQFGKYLVRRPDCVWIQYVNLPDLGFVLLARLLGFTVLVTPHLGSNWRSQSNPLLRSLSGWILSVVHRIALISETQQAEIKLPPKVPRALIRNFLPLTIWHTEPPTVPNRPHGEVRLVHAGRLSAGKGTFLLVDVCKRLRDTGVPFVTHISGGADADTMRRLKDLIASYHLNEQVKVLGRVTDSELLELLRSSDVLVHLSKIDSYPLIVLECTAYGVFPICMELAGARDMVETYDGLIVSERDAVLETADFITKAQLSSIQARAVEAASRVRADYHWDACVAALESALAATVTRSEPQVHPTTA